MTGPGVRFIPESHLYLDESLTEFPSVTRVISAAGMMPRRRSSPEDQDYFRDRGSKAHKALELFDRKTLDETKLDPVLKPFLDQWKWWLIQTGAEVVENERVVSWSRGGLWFAGTLDRRVRIPGRRRLVQVEFKTGNPEDWHAIQTAAYHLAFGVEEDERLGLYFSPNGKKPRPEWHNDYGNRDRFLSALDLYFWRAKRGLLPTTEEAA